MKRAQGSQESDAVRTWLKPQPKDLEIAVPRTARKRKIDRGSHFLSKTRGPLSSSFQHPNPSPSLFVFLTRGLIVE
jgi:hypothetical protein